MDMPPLDAPEVTADQTAPAGVRHPPWVFIAIGALALAVLIVALIGMTIARGEQFAFDRAIMLMMREPENMLIPEGPLWLKPLLLDITTLGGKTVLTLAVILTTGFLLIYRHILTAALVLGGTISGSIAVALAKQLFGRPRPSLIDHFVVEHSASFPSGHAANSAIIYLTIALILMQIVEKRAARRFLFGSMIALVTAIGCSRVYLGVHWPSDVLTGWAFGSLWALAWWSIGAWLRVKLPHKR
jgi:undecaprenyl-diphosphatase